MARVITCPNCGEEKQHHAKGMCETCYRRWQKGNSPGIIVVCVDCGEEKKHYAKGLCQSCYMYPYHAQWRVENRESQNAYWRTYYHEHKPERTMSIQKWAQKNPESGRVCSARYLARKSNLPDTLTDEQAQFLLAIGRAIYPNEELQLDHVVPVSRGGGTTLANMHAIPARLNQSKYDALPEDIYRQLSLSVRG